MNARLIFAAALLAPFACWQVSATEVTVKLPQKLEVVIEESHVALSKILNGDPSGYAALFADRHDITNPRRIQVLHLRRYLAYCGPERSA
jgi:hypothetical protein